MKVINDGRNDYKKIFEELENGKTNLFNVKCRAGRYKVFNQPALIIPVENDNCWDNGYYLGYKLKRGSKYGVLKVSLK